jgi:hypothetical protein
MNPHQSARLSFRRREHKFEAKAGGIYPPAEDVHVSWTAAN